VCFAFDVTPDRSKAAIAVCGRRHDGAAHVEIIEHRPGTRWLPGRLGELCDEHTPEGVVCDAVGPASSLIHDVEQQSVNVTTVSATEYGQACSRLVDAVAERRFTIWDRGSWWRRCAAL
jgi:hypothetical protein